MNEYIEREALIKTLNKNNIPYNADVNYFIMYASTVDVAKIVYCKNCKHRDKKGVCEKFRQRYPFFSEDNFYCGFGERSET